MQQIQLKVVEYAELNTNRGATSHFSVSEKQVRQWRLKKDDLNLMPKKKKRVEGKHGQMLR